MGRRTKRRGVNERALSLAQLDSLVGLAELHRLR
jgi:hypothetical protein